MTRPPAFVTGVIRAADQALGALEALLVLVLAAMIVLVFSNVVLRYGFDSGITVTDEVSRMMFVWLAFVGAIAVSRRHQQLGVDFVVEALPKGPQRLVRVIGNLAILFSALVLVIGAWGQMQLNWINTAPVSGLPTAITYAAPWLGGIGIALIALCNALGAAFGLPPAAHHEESPGA